MPSRKKRTAEEYEEEFDNIIDYTNVNVDEIFSEEDFINQTIQGDVDGSFSLQFLAKLGETNKLKEIIAKNRVTELPGVFPIPRKFSRTEISFIRQGIEQGKTQRQIAQELGRPKGSVSSRISRMRKKGLL